MTPQPIMRAMTPDDLPDVAQLHADVFGPGRFARSAYRVREGRPGVHVTPFCRVVTCGNRLIGALSFTYVDIGGQLGALLLGPIAVLPGFINKGFGRGMIAESMVLAYREDIQLVILVGDAPYYDPLGFKPVPPGQILMPGPVNPSRLLAAELKPDALPEFRGLITAC